MLVGAVPNLRALWDAGYRKEQILEANLGVAMKMLSNYVNHIADTPLDRELGAFAWDPASWMFDGR